MYIDNEIATVDNHRRLLDRAEAALETSRKLNPDIDGEVLRCETVSQFAELARRYASEGSASMSRAMAVAAAHLGIIFRDDEKIHSPRRAA